MVAPETLARIRELAALKHTLTFMAQTLNREGHETPSGRPGTRWNHESVRRTAKAAQISVSYAWSPVRPPRH